jgi:outer membrane protein OmpU
MKKLLFGTAIAALFTAPAAAGPIAVTVGGYYNSMVYSVDSDNVGSNFEDISLQEDAEIIFKGKGKSDTGLEFGFQVQLEATTSSDQIDEHYIYVKGGFGKIEIGAENSAAYKAQVMAPTFLGWKTYDNNFATWTKVAKYEKPYHDNYSGDANKINYYSPRINGVQLVASYTPNGNSTSGTGMVLADDLAADGKSNNIMSYGLSYSGEVSGIGVKASYTREEAEATKGAFVEQDVDETSYGIQLKSGNITFGGNYFEADESTIGGNNWEIYHYGLAYKMGDTTLGFGIQNQEDTNKTTGENDTTITVIGGSTKLMSGVKLTYSYEMVESDDAAKGDSDFLGAGLLLKF